MAKFLSLMQKSLTNLDGLSRILLAGWVLVMLSLPALHIWVGNQAMLQGLALGILFQVALVLRVLYRAWGWWGMLRAALSVVLLTWVVLAIVVRSGLPYSNLGYTSSLQPQLLSVPLLVPLMWLMMILPAWAVAKSITRRQAGCIMRIVYALVSGMAFTAFFFYMDPLMVKLGAVQWIPAGGYFGAPWLNFIGWLVLSSILTFAIVPRRLPVSILVLIYALAWLLMLINLIIVGGMLLAALMGFLMMGIFLLGAGLSNR